MSHKIWEIHARTVGGAIRTTPEGHAEIDGLVLSEKAYLLAMRDFRPGQLVAMVRADGPNLAADQLIRHYAGGEAMNANAGRSLVAMRGVAPTPVVCRSDEVPETIPAAARW